MRRTPAAGAAGSGKFDVNAMYVTGTITSAEIKANTAILTATSVSSGMTFNEIVIDGEIEF